MDFGINKCAVLVLKRGKVVEFDGITLTDDKVIKQTGEDGYKYLGILESNEIMETQMKQIFKKEYARRLKLVLKSKLNGRNKILAINTWAVSSIRYKVE